MVDISEFYSVLKKIQIMTIWVKIMKLGNDVLSSIKQNKTDKHPIFIICTALIEYIYICDYVCIRHQRIKKTMRMVEEV